MNIIVFVFAVIVSSILLNFFYRFQRTFFIRSYYAIYELITGLPPYLSFTQLFFIKFLPPFIMTFLVYYFLNKLITLNFIWYSLIGGIAAASTSIPNLIEIYSYKGKSPEKLELQRKIISLYLVYFYHILSFSLVSGLGAYLAFLLNGFDLNKLLPSQQGLIDGLWIALIITLFSKANKPIT